MEFHEKWIQRKEFLQFLEEKKFICAVHGYGKRFRRKFTWTEHQKTHSKCRPYVCLVENCGKRFTTSSNLSRHRKLHFSYKAFTCSWSNCSERFDSQDLLTKHIQKHLMDVAFTCPLPYCGRLFSKFKDWNNHIHLEHELCEFEGDRKYSTPKNEHKQCFQELEPSWSHDKVRDQVFKAKMDWKQVQLLPCLRALPFDATNGDGWISGDMDKSTAILGTKLETINAMEKKTQTKTMLDALLYDSEDAETRATEKSNAYVVHQKRTMDEIDHYIFKSASISSPVSCKRIKIDNRKGFSLHSAVQFGVYDRSEP